MRATARAATAILLLVLTAAIAHAQELAPPHQIAAIVRTPGGEPLAGAIVTLFGKDGTKLKMVATNAAGEVRFAELPDGSYRLKCELAGFFTETIGPIPLRSGPNAPQLPRQLDIRLVAGPIVFDRAEARRPR